MSVIVSWFEDTPVLIWVSIVLLFLFGIAISVIRIQKFDSVRIFSMAIPGLMISLGIFGTFYGIYSVLQELDFGDKREIDESLALLLQGMKTAFASSLLGLGGAVVYKLISVAIQATLPGRKVQPNEDVVAALHSIREAIAGNGDGSLMKKLESVEIRLGQVKQAISGDSDSSLAAQMQEMINQNRTGFENLTTEMQNLRNENRTELGKLGTSIQGLREESKTGFGKLDGLAEAIRDSLVKNLEKLMGDLRKIIATQLNERLKKLTDKIEDALIKRFGETFIEFNKAVQALKKWQEDHRQQVKELTAAFSETAKRFEQIKDNCEKIPPTMKELELIVRSINVQITELDARLSAFANMRKQAESALPTIQKDLNTIVGDIKKLNGALCTDLSNASGDFKRVAKQMIADVSASRKKFNEDLEKEFASITRAYGQNMIAIAERCAERIEQADKGGRK